MAKPIEIAFSSDTKEVIRGTKDIADGFDDVSDALRDMEKDSKDATEALEDGSKDAIKSTGKLEDALKDALDGTKNLEKDGKDAFDSLSDGARKSGKDTGDSMKGGLSRASEGMDEFKDEANSTAKEAAASFDGSAESIGDVFQELAANAFAGFGPAGQVAGLAAAIGLGIAITKLQEAADVNTEAKEAMAELGREIYDTGGKLDEADLANKIADIAFALGQEDVWYKWGDQAQTNVGMVKDALEGVSDAIAQDAFKALAGDLEAAGRAQGELGESIARDTGTLKDHILMVDEYGRTILTTEGDAIQSSIDARRDLQERIEEETGVRQGANDEVEYYTQVMGESTGQVEAANEALEAQKDALEAQADALNESADAAQTAMGASIDWESTLDDTTEAIKKRGKATNNDTKAGRENNQALLDMASSGWAVVEAQVAQGDSSKTVTATAQEARSAFLVAADAAGYSATEARALADAYGLVPGNVDTLVQAQGTEKVKEDLEAIPESKDTTVTTTENGASEAAAAVESIPGSKDVTINATDGGSATAVQGAVEGIQGKDVDIKVADKGTTAQVQEQINGLKGKTVDVNVRIANAQAIRDELASLTAPRSVSVTVNQRAGKSVTP